MANIQGSGPKIRIHTSTAGNPRTSEVRPDGRFRVASYNVENMFDAVDDPDRRDEDTPPKSEADMRKVAEAIRRADADVVALQEVEKLEVLDDFLDKYLPGEFPHRVLVEGNDQRGIDVALISRHPIEQVTSHKNNRFPVPGQRPTTFRRDFLKVDLKVGKFPFTVYTAHLKSHGGGDPADQLRLGEAREGVRIVKENMRRYPGQRFVVTGDMNDVPDSPVGRTLVGSEGSDWHLNSALDAVDGSRVTHPRTRRQIDYILYPDSMSDEFLGAGIQRLPREQTGSDHNLVWADFKLKE